MVPVQKLVWSPALVPRLLFLIQRMVLLRLLFLIQRMVLLRVGRSAESRFGQRVIGSKAEVTWYYESVANHSLRPLQRVIRTAS